MRYRDWRYLVSLGWSGAVAYRLLNLLANGWSVSEARRSADELRRSLELDERAPSYGGLAF